MRSRQAETEHKSETTPTIEVIDFKTKFAESKAYAKVRILEVKGKNFQCCEVLKVSYHVLNGAMSQMPRCKLIPLNVAS